MIVNSLREMMIIVLGLQGKWKTNSTDMELRGKYIKEIIPKKITDLMSNNKENIGDIRVEGFNGKGNKCRVPDIQIFLKYTNSLWHVMILFTADGTGFYVCIIRNKKKGIPHSVEWARRTLTSKKINLENFETIISLQDQGARGGSLENENVIALHYREKDIPPDNEIIQKIISLLGLVSFLDEEYKTESNTSAHVSKSAVDYGVSGSQKKMEQEMEPDWQGQREVLVNQILSMLGKLSYKFLEHLVVDLLLAMEYGYAGIVVGHPNDGGIDGIIKRDPLGLDLIYVQAKRWKSQVGEPEVARFVGALEKRHAQKGVYFTTSYFSNEAKDFVDRIRNKVVLINGRELASLMIDYEVGVSKSNRDGLPALDLDYFDEERINRKSRYTSPPHCPPC